jgi:hypothetical protein
VRDGSNFQNRRKFWTGSLKFFDPNRPGGYPEFEPVSLSILALRFSRSGPDGRWVVPPGRCQLGRRLRPQSLSVRTNEVGQGLSIEQTIKNRILENAANFERRHKKVSPGVGPYFFPSSSARASLLAVRFSRSGLARGDHACDATTHRVLADPQSRVWRDAYVVFLSYEESPPRGNCLNLLISLALPSGIEPLFQP